MNLVSATTAVKLIELINKSPITYHTLKRLNVINKL